VKYISHSTVFIKWASPPPTKNIACLYSIQDGCTFPRQSASLNPNKPALLIRRFIYSYKWHNVNHVMLKSCEFAFVF
jgi:hypothetical protein